jgi:hypothetical protein
MFSFLINCFAFCFTGRWPTRSWVGQPAFQAPPAVILLADAYVESLSSQMTPRRKSDLHHEFLRNFFAGFTNPDGWMEGGTEASRCGFQAGQETRRAKHDKLNEYMEGFGYVPCEAEGNLTVRSEHSGFRPRNRPGEQWWLWLLSAIDDAESDAIKSTKNSKAGVDVRISGFLSPKGRYGHMGCCEREFRATKIFRVNGGRHELRFL